MSGNAGLGAMKPAEVFGRDREWRALADFTADPRPEATLGIVSGRRRQGKTYLLRSIAKAAGGFFFEAAEATEADSLRMFGAALARHAGFPGGLSFPRWDDALAYLFARGTGAPAPVVIDEFPFLIKASPHLPSLLKRELDAHGPSQDSRSRTRLLLCGSAMSVMGNLLAGTAPLRGRAGLEMLIQPFAYREAAAFWGAADPRLAILLHAIVGGTPAYRRQFVRDDAPVGLADFDDWVVRAVLSPDRPLLREARYLLAEETDIRDPALYHSVLSAVAAGSHRWGGIASYVGRKSSEISHPLHVLEGCRLVIREEDCFRSGRSEYRIAEPLLAFYEAVMRPRWADLEQGMATAVWQDSRSRYLSGVVGPHFEQLCRDFARQHGRAEFGQPVGEVGHGTLADPAHKTQIEVDVAVLGPAQPGERRAAVSIGEVKWGEVMGLRHLARLQRALALLALKGYDTSETVLACYAGAGWDDELAAAGAAGKVRLIDPAQLYLAGPMEGVAAFPS
ncbi:MAG: AAA family ATPase [Streptosporangiaceae bacterium]